MKNQFRSLDEDEVDFLDSVLESTRAKEAEVKKQTREQLEAFHRLQEEAERAASLQDASSTPEMTEAWAAGSRKRKKGRETAIAGVKLRRTSTIEKPLAGSASPTKGPQPCDTALQPVADLTTKSTETPKGKETGVKTVEAASPAEQPSNRDVTTPKSSSVPTGGLGLGAYSSDEDD